MPVGQAYQVTLDPAVQDERIIGLTYLQRDVPEGFEHTLTVYFLPEGETNWQRLETERYVENLVVADVQAGDGTYAVMSTVEMPPLSPGRNLFTYPLAVPQDVATALSVAQGTVLPEWLKPARRATWERRRRLSSSAVAIGWISLQVTW